MTLIAMCRFDWRWIMLLFIGLSLVSAPSFSSAITVGEHCFGGIVFYVDDSGEHGLVAAKRNIAGKSHGMEPENFNWYDAKAACENFVNDGYNDWFLPNEWQLGKLYLQRAVVGGFYDHFYWSSSREDDENAWYIYFHSGDQNSDSRMASGRVRPVRAF